MCQGYAVFPPLPLDARKSWLATRVERGSRDLESGAERSRDAFETRLAGRLAETVFIIFQLIRRCCFIGTINTDTNTSGVAANGLLPRKKKANPRLSSRSSACRRQHRLPIAPWMSRSWRRVATAYCVDWAPSLYDVANAVCKRALNYCLIPTYVPDADIVRSTAI
jgi:hypothetical protein